jgi:phosphatidylserine decarboxylase
MPWQDSRFSGALTRHMMDKYTLPESPSRFAFPVASAGYPLIFAAAFATGVLALLQLRALALLGLAVTIFIAYFFRDPDRVIPVSDGALVSPADGRVVNAGKVDRSLFYEGPCQKVSIFMSVFNVHVNRIPHDGQVDKIEYHPGKFVNASLDKASEDNERNAVFIVTDQSQRYCVVQIAGLIARRIICHIQAGETVHRGRRFGLICFGSRLDIYLPIDATLNVAVGDRVRAGNSIVGYFSRQ